MAMIKSFTDLSQSKTLSKILPIGSADMYYMNSTKHVLVIPNYETDFFKLQEDDVPCWSLAALLSVLPKKYYPIKDHETYLILGKPKDKWCALYWDTTGMQNGEQTLADNPVDACYEMIMRLNELKML